MNTEPDDRDVIAELRRELSGIVPSPEFDARVRQRIAAEQHDARPTKFGWTWLLPVGAGAAAVVVAIVMFGRADPGAPSPAPDVPARAAIGATPAPGLGAAAAPGESAPPVRASASADPSVRSPRAVSADARGGASLPDARVAAPTDRLDVQTSQPAILRAMWERFAHDSAAGVPAFAAPVPLSSADAGEPAITVPDINPAADITIPTLEIDPLVVKWIVEPPRPPAPQFLPLFRRVSALLAERSAQ